MSEQGFIIARDGYDNVEMQLKDDANGARYVELKLKGFRAIKSGDYVFIIKDGRHLPANDYNDCVDIREMDKPVRAVGDKISLGKPEEPPNLSVVIANTGTAYQNHDGLWAPALTSNAGVRMKSYEWVPLLEKVGPVEVIYLGDGK